MTSNFADLMEETFAGIDRTNAMAADGIADALRRHGGVDLDALIEALARRAADIPVTKLRAGPLEIDLIERRVERNGRAIDLLPREFRLLEYMMRRKGSVLTREMLFMDVWKYKFDPKTNLVDVHMGRLRRKIDWPHERPLIVNIRGKGFMLRVEEGH